MLGGGGIGMPGAGGLGAGLGGGRGGFGGMEVPGMSALGGLMGGGGRNDWTYLARGGEIEVKTLKLKSVAAADTVAAVEKAFPKAKGLKVIAEPVSNIIIIIADPAAMKDITKLIEELDGKPKTGSTGPDRGGGRGGSSRVQAGGPGGSFGPPGMDPSRGGPPMGAGPGGAAKAGGLTVFALKNANAEELAAVLKKVFPTAEITAEARTNQLIVRVSEKDMADFEKLIVRLDTK